MVVDVTDEDVVGTYLELIDEFVAGETSASEFSLTYLERFKREERAYSDETYEILQYLFAEADAHCADPELREETSDGIDSAELLEAALDAKARLEAKRAE